MYLQVEGVAMGSPLGPTFANYYMGHLENKVFNGTTCKPNIYVRYVDDIFIQVKTENQLIELKQLFEKNSVLKFTYELNAHSKLPFLDVMVTSTTNKFKTTVYHKPTNNGNCLSANSECIDRYKDSVAISYLNRAYKISQNWEDFDKEVQHIKQILVNNDYPNSKIDRLVNKFLNKKHQSQESDTNETVASIPIFYNNQMHRNYKIEERVLKDIISTNTNCTDNQKLNIVFYYKNLKTSNLAMKNNMTATPSLLRQTNIVYNFECPLPHCRAERYIGMTQSTLSRRLTNHAQSGSIFEHFKYEHNCKPSREQLVNNTTILARADNRFKLAIKEALLILEHAPAINKQFDNFVNILKLHTHRKLNSNFENQHLPVSNLSPLSPSPSQQIQPMPPTIPTCESHVIFSSSPILQSVTKPVMSTPPFGEGEVVEIENVNLVNLDVLPDISTVLLSFGISYHNLRQVPLKDYHWWSFDECVGVADDATISQRIKLMVRKARTHPITDL